MNLTDDAFEDWKANRKKDHAAMSQKNPVNSEVPEPLMDQDFEEDRYHACQKCGSLNVSLDLSTNKAVCSKCGGKNDNVHKVNFRKQIEDMKKKEEEEMEEAERRGVSFGSIG